MDRGDMLILCCHVLVIKLIKDLVVVYIKRKQNRTLCLFWQKAYTTHGHVIKEDALRSVDILDTR